MLNHSEGGIRGGCFVIWKKEITLYFHLTDAKGCFMYIKELNEINEQPKSTRYGSDYFFFLRFGCGKR